MRWYETRTFWRWALGQRWHGCVHWEPRDAWVGCFVTWDAGAVHVYVCLLPCLPLHIVRRRRRPEECRQ